MNKYFNQKGAVIVLFAVLLPIMMFSAGLAIDVGYAYTQRSDLQNIADTAALAGAHQLPDTSTATSYAKKYIEKNPDVSATLSSIDFPKTNRIAVTVSKTIDLFFFKSFVDTDTLTISATATAEATKASTDGSIFEYCLIHGDTSNPFQLGGGQDNIYYDKFACNAKLLFQNSQNRNKDRFENAELRLYKKDYPSQTELNDMPVLGDKTKLYEAFKNYTVADEKLDISLDSQKAFIDNLSSHALNPKILEIDVNNSYTYDPATKSITIDKQAVDKQYTIYKTNGDKFSIANLKKAGYTGIYITNNSSNFHLQCTDIIDNFNWSVVAEKALEVHNLSMGGLNSQAFICTKGDELKILGTSSMQQGASHIFAYAPNGKLYVHDNFENYGCMIGKEIDLQGGNHKLHGGTLSSDFGTPGSSSSSGTSSVKLIE